MTRPTALVAAAQRRREDAEERVGQAIRTAERRRQPVTFRGIAALAGVSTDFLYRHAQLREQIERLRVHTGSRQAVAPPSDGSPVNIVRVLTEQLREERRARAEEATQLRQALAVAHEELLTLRRQLGHE
jgi:hypothetical protein